MTNISSLVQSLPQVSQSRMISSGFGVWMVWQGSTNTTAHNALRDFGAIRMAEEPSQSLWFSPGPDVFRALARLQIWSKLNPIPVFAQVFPVTLSVGYDLTRTLAVPAEFSRQTAEAPKNYEVWIHPKLKDQVKLIAGLDLVDRGGMAGLANVGWTMLKADDGLDYESTQSWYFAIKPLGRMGEKESIKGWRGFFAEIQDLLQRQGIKYLTSPREEFVVFPLRDARSLRNLCGEMLRLIPAVKADPERIYWPCVMACTPQKGRPFSEDLPQKFNLDWNRLTPDFPHLHYRDAFMLAEWFRINEVRYGGSEETLDSWCSLSLLPDDEQSASGTLDVHIPRGLLMGDNPTCFYCGMKGHKPADCPTRNIPKVNFLLWKRLAQLDMEEITAGFARMEKQLDPVDPLPGIQELLGGGKKSEHLLIQAVFEVVSIAQLRMLRLIWRSRGKEWPEGILQLGPEEGDYIWDALEALRGHDYERADQLTKQARLKYSRSFVPSSLQAILALEMAGDAHQAHFYFEESERL
ncbi:MAG: tetratricopeptide repeat protein, partial [Desulfovibrionaceae bacterium]